MKITNKDALFVGIIALVFGAIGLGVGWNSKKCVCPLEPKANKIEFSLPQIMDTVHLERATTYQPTVAQCDSNPLTTADGSKINPDYYQKWVALSRDLLTRWGGQFDYGDTLEIYSAKNPNLNGQWEVHDCMAPRYKMSIDFLLEPEKNYPKLGVGKDVKIIYCPENMN